MDRNKVKAVFIFGILVSILAACSEEVTTAPSPILAPMVATATLSPVELAPVPFTPSATRTPIFPLSPTPDSTQQAWHSSAIAMSTLERAMYEQALDNKATQVAEFSISCDKYLLNKYSSQISPDGNWFAASCGYKRDQTLIVQNKQGVMWVLKYKDFFVHEHMGSLYPVFWSPDGGYLYFSANIGYSGGGNQCFPQQRGNYGLFRLNLNKGSWTSLIPATESFPGYEIKFSPTGRRYAVSKSGITIADIKTGDIIQINVSTLMNLSWSPDGRYLAYSLANCSQSSDLAQSTAIYIWDSVTGQVQLLFIFTVEGMILHLESWNDDSTLRVLAEKWVGKDTLYEVYIYDIAKKDFVFSGTATPYP